MQTYLPIFGLECRRCGTSPVVGIQETPNIIHSTGLCGPHFFADRLMVDWEEWNNSPESSE